MNGQQEETPLQTALATGGCILTLVTCGAALWWISVLLGWAL